MKDAQCQFGSVNVVTGAEQEGYMEAGKMKFRPVPWWKKLFRNINEIKLPVELVEEYVGIADVTVHKWTGGEYTECAALYRKYNKFDGKTHSLWIIRRGHYCFFDVNAWDRDKQLVRK